MMKGTVNVIAASNDYYVPYLGVLIQSIMDNCSHDRNYHLYVLHTDISDEHMSVISKSLLSNFKIDFLDVSSHMAEYGDLYISNHIKIETYFRLLLPNLLPNVEKCLYIDCDVIANHDVSELYDKDIDDYYLAGTRDADSAANYNTDEHYKQYVDQILELKKPYDYLQAGIILMNLKKFRAELDSSKLMKTALSRKWMFHDQDTLNYLCKNHIMFLEYEWNFVYDYSESYRRSTNSIINTTIQHIAATLKRL